MPASGPAAGTPGVVTLGVVTGLASEAACVAPTRARVACAGANAARAGVEAERLMASGCSALVSFGLAGGLDPALPSGMLVIASAVVAPDGDLYAVDEVWRRRLISGLDAGCRYADGPIAGAAAAVASAEEKHSLFTRSGAVAVDMESLAVAHAARAHEVPMLIVRAIADPAGRFVPSWLDGVIDAAGWPRAAAVLAGLAAHPGDAVALCRLGLDARRGMASLRRVAARAGPFLSFDA